MLIAHILGTGLVADAFFIAFKFPNLFRRLFGEGALNAAFVPLYSACLQEKGKASATQFASEAMAIIVTWMLFFTFIAMAVMPWIMTVQAAGFIDQPEKFDLTVMLARITFPYLLFMVLAAVLSGMLNSVGKFSAAAAAPVLLNLSLITALFLIHVKVTPLPGQSLAYAVVVAGALQFMLLVWACYKNGIMVRLPRPRLSRDVRKLLVLMAPGVFGAGVVQINVLVGDLLATLLEEGSVSYLYYADRINQLPLGVIGIAVGVALLPLLTRQIKAGDTAASHASINQAVEFCLVLTFPAAFALISIPELIVSVLFQRGAFSQEAAIATAEALRAFAFGLPAYVLIKVLAPGFFARQDTTTPVKIAIVAMIVNLILAISLMVFFAHAGIAMAAALSAWLNAGLLFMILQKRGHFIMNTQLPVVVFKSFLVAMMMAVCLWGGVQFFEPVFVLDLYKYLGLGVLIIGALIFYFGLCQILGIFRFNRLKSPSIS